MPQVVTYQVDDETEVAIEIEPIEGFTPAGARDAEAFVAQAIEPAVATAKAILEKVKALSPHGVEVRFGIKVTGTANWLVAKAATEGNFEVTLSWEPEPRVGAAGDGIA